MFSQIQALIMYWIGNSVENQNHSLGNSRRAMASVAMASVALVMALLSTCRLGYEWDSNPAPPRWEASTTVPTWSPFSSLTFDRRCLTWRKTRVTGASKPLNRWLKSILNWWVRSPCVCVHPLLLQPTVVFNNEEAWVWSILLPTHSKSCLHFTVFDCNMSWLPAYCISYWALYMCIT